MQRKILLLVAVMLRLSFSLLGQDFGGNNSVWIYDFTGGYTSGVTEVYYSRDTTIDNRSIKILEKRAIRKINGNVVTFPRSPVYINDQDGVVKYSQDLVHFDTLYNFQSEIGDSWRIPERKFNGELGEDVLNPFVVDKFTLPINGVYTDCMGVIYESSNIVIDTICQGIGSRLFYILPFDFKYVAADGGEGGLLRCFSNDVLGVVPHEYPFSIFGPGFSFSAFEFDCDQLTSIESLPTSFNQINIFPNPTSGFISVKSKNTHIENIKIYNLQGQLVRLQQIQGQEIKMDVRDLNAGIYFILINDSYYEKVVVQE